MKISEIKYIGPFLAKVAIRSPSPIHKLSEVIRVASENTYYPEHPRKSLVKRILDNLLWLIKYREINYYYNFYGLDIVNSHPDTYLPINLHDRERRKLNGANTYSPQIPLLVDKFLFYKYMTSFGIPVSS